MSVRRGWVIAAWVVAGAAVCGAVAFGVSWWLIDPHLEGADEYPGGVVLRDNAGTVLRVSLGPEDVDCRPYYVASENDWIVKALVAAEDRRFFEHAGVNLPSVVRATFQNITSLRRVSGASTITMQATRLICPHPRTLAWKYVEAFRAAGLKVGFYFSIKDWHHPDYIVDRTHPLFRQLERAGKKGEELRAAVAKLNEGRDWERYRKYMYDQVRELLTQYGKIDIIWFDYTVKDKEYGKTYKSWDAVRLVKMTRELQPGILIDNRLDLMDTDDGWDFVTPEQFKVQKWPTIRGKRVPWETCQTFSGSWGYYRDEDTWKSVPQLIELLVHSVSKGGNLIMNVGPTARGEFDGRAKERLAGFAKWMHWNSRSIYGCGEAPEGFAAPNGTLLTYNAKTGRLYVHLCDYPMGFLPVAFLDKVEYVQFLHDGSEIALRQPYKRHSQSGDQIGELGGFVLPVKKPDVEIPVVECWLKK